MHFFPKADAGLLSPTSKEQHLPVRPTTVGPIYDADNIGSPVELWTPETDSCFYPRNVDPYASASIPQQYAGPRSRYLRARLAKNERLRLSMLWYYGRDLDTDSELLSGLQEKACLAQESSGWEFAVVGILDINVYIRLATVGLPLAILPRGETLCAHTVTQPPGNVFHLPNMLEDWRFRDSPYVEQGGLTAYAGVPLRMQHDSGECIGIGSLCVASATSQPPLSKQQQQTLARLADWIVADIAQCTRARRQRERHRLAELIATAENVSDDLDPEESVLNILRTAYPNELISLRPLEPDQYGFDERHTGTPTTLENGLWEDTAYIDQFIATSNHNDTPEDRVVRHISARCSSKLGHSLLVVATKNFRRIFDDVDAWFVQTCATKFTQIWQKCLLSEAIRAKETFLRGVSHQLRTPIHGILGAAELLSEDLRVRNQSDSTSVPPSLMETGNLTENTGNALLYLDTISGAGRELMSTVNSMITLNRWADVALAERRYGMHDVEVLESELLKRLSEASIRHASSKVSIFVSCDLPRDCNVLQIDLGMLQDSIFPLLVNAIQNTLEGVVTITFSMREGTKSLVIDVEDTGCGIHPDDQGRIFELYEKADEHSMGAGLGLPLATKFATLLHGSIVLVSSEVGRGSHFRATFQDVNATKLPVPSRAVMPLLQYLPPKFHQLGADLPHTYLASNLAKFLTRSGFSPSKIPTEHSFMIFEYIADSEQAFGYFSSLLPNQVAICLVPTAVHSESLRKLPNVIYASGPFSTLKLFSTLQQADDLAMMLQNSHEGPVETKNVYSNHGGCTGDGAPSKSVCSSPDEGYISMNASSSHSDDLGQTLRLCTELVPGYDFPLTGQSERSAIVKRPLAPLAPTRSANPLALVVDDNAVNLRILEMYCKKRGLPYLSATDGRQAVDMYSKQQALCAAGSGASIELVLMDLQMPVCDGVRATQQIRSLEQQYGWSSSVVFIVTGQDSQSDREAASAAGADDYMVKPIGMGHLDSDVKRYFPAFKL